ncbi:unnamed protein product [Cuscuta europaea]|uniref:Uncharacterized protein n=1 Tax=Cuscuta europaea TaxID=41803 RepID=A0A9P0Z920_CUSEU|nr:unnamed protein product [Cuscuta europaea]
MFPEALRETKKPEKDSDIYDTFAKCEVDYVINTNYVLKHIYILHSSKKVLFTYHSGMSKNLSAFTKKVCVVDNSILIYLLFSYSTKNCTFYTLFAYS